MERQKQKHFIVSDLTGREVLIEQTDEGMTLEAAIELLTDTVDNFRGPALKVQLGTLVKSDKQAPYVRPRLTFRIKCDEGTETARREIDATGLNSSTLFAMLMKQQDENRALMMQMLQDKYNAQIASITQKLEDTKAESKTPFFEMALDKLAKQWMQAEQMKKGPAGPIAGNTGENKAQPEQQAAPVADASKNDITNPEVRKQLGQAVSELTKKGVTVEDFALLNQYAEANPAMLEMLLKEIRGQA